MCTSPAVSAPQFQDTSDGPFFFFHFCCRRRSECAGIFVLFEVRVKAALQLCRSISWSMEVEASSWGGVVLGRLPLAFASFQYL